MNKKKKLIHSLIHWLIQYVLSHYVPGTFPGSWVYSLEKEEDIVWETKNVKIHFENEKF